MESYSHRRDTRRRREGNGALREVPRGDWRASATQSFRALIRRSCSAGGSWAMKLSTSEMICSTSSVVLLLVFIPRSQPESTMLRDKGVKSTPQYSFLVFDNAQDLVVLLPFGPTCLGGLESDLTACFRRHCLHASLAALLTAFPPHFSHYARNLGLGKGFPHELIAKLVYVSRSLGSA